MRISYFVLALLSLGTAASADWDSEPLAPAAVRSSLAVDDAGTVHVAFDSPAHEVWYGIRSEAGWTVERLSTGVSWPALRLTSEGQPWVVFGEDGPATGNLILARNEAGIWTLEDTGIFGHFASLAIDDNDRPQLAYNVDPLLWYAHRDNSTWSVVEPDVVSWLSFMERTPVEVGPAGTLYIGYVNQLPQRNVRLATRTGSTWAEHPLSDGQHVSLDLDENDQLHVCFSNDQDQLEYRIHGTSTAEIVDDIRPVGETAMVVAASGAVHIAYESSEGLRYAVRTTGGWTLGRIAPSGTLASIDTGPVSVHVAYVDAGTLQHAWRTEAVSNSQTSVGRMKHRFGGRH